jgi:hypothetical protein
MIKVSGAFLRIAPTFSMAHSRFAALLAGNGLVIGGQWEGSIVGLMSTLTHCMEIVEYATSQGGRYTH